MNKEAQHDPWSYSNDPLLRQSSVQGDNIVMSCLLCESYLQLNK